MLGQMVKFVGEVEYTENLNANARYQKQTDNKEFCQLGS